MRPVGPRDPRTAGEQAGQVELAVIPATHRDEAPDTGICHVGRDRRRVHRNPDVDVTHGRADGPGETVADHGVRGDAPAPAADIARVTREPTGAVAGSHTVARGQTTVAAPAAVLGVGPEVAAEEAAERQASRTPGRNVHAGVDGNVGARVGRPGIGADVGRARVAAAAVGHAARAGLSTVAGAVAADGRRAHVHGDVRTSVGAPVGGDVDARVRAGVDRRAGPAVARAAHARLAGDEGADAVAAARHDDGDVRGIRRVRSVGDVRGIDRCVGHVDRRGCVRNIDHDGDVATVRDRRPVGRVHGVRGDVDRRLGPVVGGSPVTRVVADAGLGAAAVDLVGGSVDVLVVDDGILSDAPGGAETEHQGQRGKIAHRKRSFLGTVLGVSWGAIYVAREVARSVFAGRTIQKQRLNIAVFWGFVNPRVRFWLILRLLPHLPPSFLSSTH